LAKTSLAAFLSREGWISRRPDQPTTLFVKRTTKNPSKIYSVKSTFLCKLSGTPRKGWDNGHEIDGSRMWLRGLPDC
jgi:hypothetical protein